MSVIDTQIYIISYSSLIQILQHSVIKMQHEAGISWYLHTLPNPQDGIWL